MPRQGFKSPLQVSMPVTIHKGLSAAPAHVICPDHSTWPRFPGVGNKLGVAWFHIYWAPAPCKTVWQVWGGVPRVTCHSHGSRTAQGWHLALLFHQESGSARNLEAGPTEPEPAPLTGRGEGPGCLSLGTHLASCSMDPVLKRSVFNCLNEIYFKPRHLFFIFLLIRRIRSLERWMKML